MRTDVVGLKGGAKQLWLKLHKREVLDYYLLHDIAATCEEFNMGILTVQDMIKNSGEELFEKPVPPAEISNDKILIRLELVEGRTRETNGLVRQLQEDYNNFIPSVAEQVARGYLIPAIVKGLKTIKLPALLEGSGIDEDGEPFESLEKRGKG